MRSITFQQANTSDGSYDVMLPAPYPVTVDAGANVILGFVPTPLARAEGLLFVERVLSQRVDPLSVVGSFPVYLDDQGIYTVTRVITEVIAIDGVLVTQKEEA